MPANQGIEAKKGDGVFNKCPERDFQYREKELASWLCYYKALQMGEASKVVPVDKLSVVITLVLAFIFLHEKFTPRSIAGCILIGAGTLLMVLS